MLLAIVRNLPLRQPTVLSARAVRKILQVTDGVTAKVFRILNDLAIEAIETGAERIAEDAIERWQRWPMSYCRPGLAGMRTSMA